MEETNGYVKWSALVIFITPIIFALMSGSVVGYQYLDKSTCEKINYIDKKVEKVRDDTHAELKKISEVTHEMNILIALIADKVGVKK